MKKSLFLIIFINFVATANIGPILDDVAYNEDFVWDDVYPPKSWPIQGKWLKSWARDFVLTFRNTISVDTLKILGFIVPMYVGLKQMDKDLHSCFYMPCCHKNVHQVPHSLCELADKGVPAMIGVLSSLSVFSNDVELRLTSYTYTQSAVAYWIAKNIFKNSCKRDFNLRPKNQNFCSCDACAAHGGFPSGHTGEAVLAAVIFGLRHGPVWGVPLGAFATLVFGVSVSANRHYVSQVIGGVGLGLIFSAASLRLIKSKFPEDLGCSLYADRHGNPGVNISYSF